VYPSSLGARLPDVNGAHGTLGTPNNSNKTKPAGIPASSWADHRLVIFDAHTHHDDSPAVTTNCKQNAHVGMPIGQHCTDERFWSYAASEVKVDLTVQSYRRSSSVGGSTP